ncbi:ABC transporter ATP-binding protein [Stackebrandtia nassauensis]|uniref:ABC transporter related protein n=1 Tax=Stackebrandtia nassauensis (strain DSM 44728 / CIP 108903 / NRRL B-16338 / NBRC 102104 / LLR-40K-21) TaxID=446470 RepID=D3Q819_STANL|nr:ATP-binding cassette domain-containing protein [Stackebrandtia nassauensis]ADD40524.1 ABC transporter related protein [Stackebrandtia nassauensis DSM 44728]
MNLPVETRKLTKKYGPITAVDALDLTVRPGEVYGFLGPNGAGKTTTLRMLLGLIKASSGTATVLGRKPGTADHLSRVGALIEGPSFYPYLSGRSNLRVMAKYAGVPDSRVSEVLELVDLAQRGKDRYSTYSLGMKQRLGVAAALLKEPQLLILDEPTNGLDPQGMADMRTLIRGLGSAGCTVLLSSHLLGEVQQICDRVGIVSGGRLITESTVADLRAAQHVRVTATPLDKAASVARELLGVEAVRVVDNHLELAVEADQTPWLNAELVKADVAVSELRSHERDLEDIFFELTGEELSHVG